MFIVPRLRPGLLSRCSVLASSQNLLASYDKISTDKNKKKIEKTNPWKEQIRRIRVIRDSFERGERAEGEGAYL